METTARCGLPMLVPGQFQKEATLNEALQLADMFLAPSVVGQSTTPPASPAAGDCYLVAAGATGDWSGMAARIAFFTAGGWRFGGPVEGMRVYDRSSQLNLTFRNGAWETGTVRATSVHVGANQVIGARQPAISAPSGGTTQDIQARSAIAAILSALQTHGLIG